MDNNKDANYKFCQNTKCEFFPCHKNIKKEEFSCLFCYCPLYPYPECGGNYKILENGLKDCSECSIPHKKDNYDYIINKLKELQNKYKNVINGQH